MELLWKFVWRLCQVSFLQESKECLQFPHFWIHLPFIHACSFFFPSIVITPEILSLFTNKERPEMGFWWFHHLQNMKKMLTNWWFCHKFGTGTNAIVVTVLFPKSHLQARMQPWTWDVQRAGGVQVSAKFAYPTRQLSTRVKYAPVWMETTPPLSI